MGLPLGFHEISVKARQNVPVHLVPVHSKNTNNVRLRNKTVIAVVQYHPKKLQFIYYVQYIYRINTVQTK